MRKALLLALVAWLGVIGPTSEVFALDPGSPWSEIRSAPDVIPLAPMIFFGTRGISVLDVCASGDTLQTPSGENGSARVAVGSTRRNYDIRVDRVTGGGEHPRFQYLFTKHFEIPACG